MNTLVNGKAYEFSDIEFEIFGYKVMDVKEIDYATKRNIANNYGTGIEPISRSTGTKTYEGKIVLGMKEVETIREKMPANMDLTDLAPFTIVISYLNNYKITTHKLFFCQFTEDNPKAKQGDGDLVMELPLVTDVHFEN